MISHIILQAWLSSGSIMTIGKDRLLLGWGKCDWLPTSDTLLKTPCFYFPDFFLKQATPWYAPEYTLDVCIDELIESLNQFPNSPIVEYAWSTPHQALFDETFNQLQPIFKTREIEKFVPFVIESSPNSMDLGQLKRSLMSVLRYALHNPVYIYGFWNKTEGMLGATPELLFKFSDELTLETMACAGSINRKNVSAAFLSDPKELHEHQLVVEGITDSLKKFGVPSVEKMELLSLSKICHLITKIKIELQQYPSFDVVAQALHPTPAVGAYPRLAGNTWLEKYQTKLDRRRFGAPVGYVLPMLDKAACYVAIRNVQWNTQEMMIAAGCGLVIESQKEREWNEIELKLHAIKELLSL